MCYSFDDVALTSVVALIVGYCIAVIVMALVKEFD